MQSIESENRFSRTLCLNEMWITMHSLVVQELWKSKPFIIDDCVREGETMRENGREKERDRETARRETKALRINDYN